MFEPTLLIDLGAPVPVVVAIAILVVGLLIVRFVIKTAFTILKIGLLVGIGVATWVGLAALTT